MKTRKEKLLIKLFDRKIHIMHELEKLLSEDNMVLIYELLKVNEEINSLKLDDEEIEVLD